MATPYENIYARFTPKITDFNFANLAYMEAEEYFETFLKSSIIKFRYCAKLSDRDETSKQFNQDLTEEEQEILSILMSIEYLTPKLLTDELLKQTLNSKDYSLYSQANQIKEIREVRDTFQREVNNLMILYTFNNSKLDGFL
jgi:hypothetical protein